MGAGTISSLGQSLGESFLTDLTLTQSNTKNHINFSMNPNNMMSPIPEMNSSKGSNTMSSLQKTEERKLTGTGNYTVPKINENDDYSDDEDDYSDDFESSVSLQGLY